MKANARPEPKHVPDEKWKRAAILVRDDPWIDYDTRASFEPCVFRRVAGRVRVLARDHLLASGSSVIDELALEDYRAMADGDALLG